MGIFFQGIYWGLFLAILVGPLLVALVQASLEQGTRAGIAVGTGIWISDLLCILAAYFGLQYIAEWIAWDGFEASVGSAGAVILLVTGVATLLTPPVSFNQPNHLLKGAKGYGFLWLKGFLINTVNPFTIIFWITVMTTVVLHNNYSPGQAFVFFSSLLGTIVFTDSLKIFLAKKIRHKLRPVHLLWVRRVAGTMLVIFGLVLAVRVFL